MDINHSKTQKRVVPKKGHTSINNRKYDPELYPKIAFEILSSKVLQSLTHLANALDCTGEAIVQWRKKYPDFNEQVKKGLKVGEEKTRKKLAEHAFKPTADVNNSLIKLLVGNVYGIKEDAPTVVINNNATFNPEQALKERGIPSPDIGIEDLDDDSCGACEVCDKKNCPGAE